MENKSTFKFFPKCVVTTQGIDTLLQRGIADFNLKMYDCLSRHFENDGEECKSDNKLNEQAIKNKDGRVVSTFDCNGTKIFIITDGLHLADSAYTEYPLCTILLPEEY